MCGIVAVIAAYQNGFLDDEKKAFSEMLFIDTFRGWDSTGVFSVHTNHNVHILKDAVPGPEFICHNKYKEFMARLWINGLFAVGHNRSATRGEINAVNAHPFWINDEIVLVQNGTWNGSHKHVKNTEVDTEAVAHIIQEHPDNVEQALQKINAAYALMWYNVPKKTLYAIRNTLRPLHMVNLKSGGTLLASELETMLYAASHNKMEIKSCEEVKPGVLHSWAINDDKTYTYSSGEVDHKYRYPKNTQQADDYEWPISYQNYPFCRHDFYNAEDWEERDGVWRKKVEPPQDHNRMVQVTMDSHVNTGSFPDMEYSFDQATKVKDELIAKISNKEPIYIELVDILPARYNKQDCRVWFVIGTVMDPNQTGNGPLVYTLVFDKTEEEVIEMCTKQSFRKATLCSPTSTFIIRSGAHLVKSFISNMEEVNVPETTT